MPVFACCTWNVENLFRPGEGEGLQDEALYRAKLAYLAGELRALAADVVALQEIGSAQALADLRAEAGGYPHAVVSSHPDPRGIRVAFLSRLKPSWSGELSPFPAQALLRLRAETEGAEGIDLTRMGRGALGIEVRKGAERIRLVTAHLKSKLVTYPGGRFAPLDEYERARGTALALLRRAAEAAALRAWTVPMLEGSDRRLVLLGDMNDEPRAVTTELLAGPSDRSISHPDKLDDVRLYNLADEIPEGRRYSRIHDKRPELIDHILVTKRMVFELERVDADVSGISPVGDDPRARQAQVVPDHAPVFARFTLSG
jgi:endonuclease/exonuclease/phosphatase family metal-dependent hydrolase